VRNNFKEKTGKQEIGRSEVKNTELRTSSTEHRKNPVL